MKKLVLTAALLLSMPTYAGINGTEVSLQTLAQATSSSTPVVTSFANTKVIGSGVEYPDVADLFNPATEVQSGFAHNLVDVAIDIASDHITMDFHNSAPFTRFASAFENTYVFRFDSAAAADIIGAKIDNNVTTLGLQPSDVRFVGNELFINVEGLAFNPSTVARVNLLALPVPEPATYAMMLAGLMLVGWASARSRRI
ncbi:PEP-CTERM sorting domain-containing protein [Nitrosospira briensis]|uniref:PEP-CTERM sorting domain-containing protein n=1 Tax=Nitrosospira briensis TaxID=35799 RepID=UPI0004689C3D|nr:PEP-CTERM sorting domain-containing protein [Nitrosospira briensis]